LFSRLRRAASWKRAGEARAFFLLTCFPLLQPAQEPPKIEPVKTSITVVENISAETPANVTVLNGSALEQAPGVNLDDRLREVPGFSLFRRTSSVVAHPTTQGVSLRGIGSSGASRTLVLWDGIPANDPFGGWVYWTQFVPEEMSRAEISRGAATSVFGDRAMSGAIALFSRPPERAHLFTSFDAGNRNTREASLGFSQAWAKTAFSGAARAFRTGGYYIVPEEIRGPVDRQASVRFVTGDARIDRYSNWGDFFLKFNLLAEERANGTVKTGNSTSLGTVSLRYERAFGDDRVSLLGYHSREGFHSIFTSVSADRRIETLQYRQRVPSQGTGGAAMWRRTRRRWNLLAGADASRVSGTSTDRLAAGGVRVGGGSQLQHGAFVQGDAVFGPARFFAGLRHSFAGGDNRFLSPSAGAVVGVRRMRLRGSVYRAFRAPTLNELYREFRVGNTATLANPDLRPETLFGAEAGADWMGENASLRLTTFRNSLDHLITNVTVSTAPNSIVRQRRNAAAAVSRGLEAEFQKSYRNWRAELGYLFADSRYSDGPRVAQIPKHQGSGRVTYSREGTIVTAGVRSYAYQFDDDLNRFRLPGFAVFELVARQRLASSLSAEVLIDNLLDRRFYTAFTPTPNVGQPQMWRAGLRWDGRLW
jgi:outer membrane receptor protein involved in Fe transport